MKQVVVIAGICSLALYTVLPIKAESSWYSNGVDSEGTRHWVQKHNWVGRFRIYETYTIDTEGRTNGALWVADCRDWRYRFHDKYGNFNWQPVLEGTMSEGDFIYVCN